MKKIIVILISVLLIVSFISLVWYGLRHARGIPTAIEKEKRVTLEVPFIAQEINLSQGISLELWDIIPPKEIKLMYQLMVLPWPKTTTAAVNAKAFHNGKEIYFYLDWQDDTQDWDLGLNKFSDACAVMFPLDEKVQTPTLMMGFLGRANIWQWKASQDRQFWLKEEPKTEAYADFHYPFEDEELFVISQDVPNSAVNDLIAIRVGTVTPKPTQNIEGRGFWDKGRWQVVFKRSLKAIDTSTTLSVNGERPSTTLRTALSERSESNGRSRTIDLEADAGFNLGTKKLSAFGVWNGSKGDRGGRKSISDWVELVLK